MSIDLGDAFGAYSREELEETLRGMDPREDPENYAAIKAALSRVLPEGVAVSCLDVAAFLLWIVAARRTVTAYRFSNGTMECIRAGEITWQQCLSDLKRVEEVEGGRYEEPSLKFHWPMNTRQVDLKLEDFPKYAVATTS